MKRQLESMGAVLVWTTYLAFAYFVGVLFFYVCSFGLRVVPDLVFIPLLNPLLGVGVAFGYFVAVPLMAWPASLAAVLVWAVIYLVLRRRYVEPDTRLYMAVGTFLVSWAVLWNVLVHLMIHFGWKISLDL
jgi:hypothetical protein